MIREFLTDLIGALCVFPGLPMLFLFIAHGMGY
jgi:hypothetical protein